ncbi:MAG: hypothetical protein J6D27_03555 [Ruminiclostridium sp.]|nr:hypothetical protein [Ruminiclostridium sp.]
MRDKLIELLKRSDDYAMSLCTDYNEAIEHNADFLLDNGVIVPSCKVGDTVYWETSDNRIVGGKIVKSSYKFRVQVDSGLEFSFDDFELGNVIFLTREEAERALKESEVKKDG